MTQKTIKVFFEEIFLKQTKNKYSTKKTYVLYIDEYWCLEILEVKDYSSENLRGYIFILVVIDIFRKLGWTIPLKKEKCSNKIKLF